MPSIVEDRRAPSTFVQSDAPLTLERIAEACGVSHITVSRALRGLPNVRPATAERIRQYALQRGYRIPLKGARRWQQEEAAASLPIIVPCEREVVQRQQVRSFFWEYMDGVLEAAAETKDKIEIVDLPKEEEELAFIQDLLKTRSMMGILNMRLQQKTIAYLYEKGIPFVSRYSVLSDFDLYPGAAIYPDRVQGYRRALLYLYEKGHRRIGFIAFDERNARLHECRAAGIFLPTPITLDRVITLSGAVNSETFVPQLQTIFSHWKRDQWPTVFLTSNDQLAYDTVVALRRIGISVPGDLSIMGFDDSVDATFCDPPLTTLRDPRKEVGRAMFRLLKEILNGNADARNRVETLPLPVIERGSVTEVSP